MPGAEGTSTAGATTSLTDAANFRTPVAQANAVTGKYLWMFSGTGAGQQAEVITYGTIGVFTWSPTLTSPAADTGWVLTTKRPQAAIDAIAEVTREAWRKQAIPVMHTALGTNNLLEDLGEFEIWSSGASSAPNGFTLAGAGASVARETVNSTADGTPSGVFNVSLTAGGGAVGTLTFTVEQKYLNSLKGQLLTLQGWLQEAVAGDAVVRVTYTDSTNTPTTNDTAGTYAGNWEAIGASTPAQIAMPNPVTNLTVQLRAALSAVTRFDDIMLLGPPIYDYPLPPACIGIGDAIMMEDGFRSKNFSIPLQYGGDWEIRRRESAPSTSKYDNDVVHFKHALPSGRHLRMTTYQAPSVQTTMTSNVDPNPVWLETAAAVRLLEQDDIEPESAAERRLNSLKQKLAQMERTSEGDIRIGHPFIEIEPR